MNLREQLAAKIAAARTAAEAGNVDEAKKLRGEAESLKSALDELKALDGLAVGYASEPMRPALPGNGDGAQPAPAATIDHSAELAKAINIVRFGDIDSPTDLVMREIYGGDYRQISFDQTKAMTRYMRRGLADPVLNRQVWDIDSVKTMLHNGMSVAEIKSTMVEGQDTLGGYAVSPTVAAQTLSRLPGLTVVRGSGALVVQTASNSIEWLKITGGNEQYRSGMRGAWGSETQTPSEKNFTVGIQNIPVNVYTYKVPFSVSLLEDASNLVDVFVQMVADTLAMDEDTAFITGDGANKPMGLLSGSANAHSFTEVASGAASSLTMGGLRNLRRGVSAQYRSRARWLGNSDTAGDIESLLDGMARPYFDDVTVGQPLLRYIWMESEAMPDVAAGAFPLLFGDFSGYAIVERMGMTIQRYNDSNTGINKVEFHVRRRIGGNVVEPYKFAVQECAVS